jgi:hypothetical protein
LAARQSRAVNDAMKEMINKAQPQPPCCPLLVLSHRPFESLPFASCSPSSSSQPNHLTSHSHQHFTQTMSGRGKGGKVLSARFSLSQTVVDLFPLKGLGKGGAKRHRKILRDNIQGTLRVALALSATPLLHTK